MTYEISIQNTSTGWHWSLFDTSSGVSKPITDSFTPCATAAQAAAEAEAEIAEPGRALRLYRKAA